MCVSALGELIQAVNYLLNGPKVSQLTFSQTGWQFVSHRHLHTYTHTRAFSQPNAGRPKIVLDDISRRREEEKMSKMVYLRLPIRVCCMSMAIVRAWWHNTIYATLHIHIHLESNLPATQVYVCVCFASSCSSPIYVCSIFSCLVLSMIHWLSVRIE